MRLTTYRLVIAFHSFYNRRKLRHNFCMFADLYFSLRNTRLKTTLSFKLTKPSIRKMYSGDIYGRKALVVVFWIYYLIIMKVNFMIMRFMQQLLIQFNKIITITLLIPVLVFNFFMLWNQSHHTVQGF